METKQSSGFETSKEEYCHRIRIIADQFKNRVEAAKATGTSKSTLQTWIDGSRIPSFDGIARLAAAAGVSLDWIAFGLGDDPQRPQPLPVPDDGSQRKLDQSLIDLISSNFKELFKQRGYGELDIDQEDLFYYYDELVTIKGQLEREITLKAFLKERSRNIDIKEKEAAEIRAEYERNRDSA